MDYRNRKYYLVKFHYLSRNFRTEILKCISSTKIYPPYNHFKDGESYDGYNVKGGWEMLVGCNKEDAEAVEYELKKAARRDGFCNFIEITKEMCGQ